MNSNHGGTKESVSRPQESVPDDYGSEIRRQGEREREYKANRFMFWLILSLFVIGLVLIGFGSKAKAWEVQEKYMVIGGYHYEQSYGCQTLERVEEILSLMEVSFEAGRQVQATDPACRNGLLAFLVIDAVRYDDGSVRVWRDSDGDYWQVVKVRPINIPKDELYLFIINREVVTKEEYERIQTGEKVRYENV